MTEIERSLATDLVAATRARAPELLVLRMLKSSLHNAKIAKQSKEELTNEEVMAVLRRELKRRQEAASMYKQGGREELATTEENEAAVIKKYLPATPELDEVRQVIARLKQEQGLSGQQAIGPLTKATLAHFKGAVDGQTVSSLARELLSQ